MRKFIVPIIYGSLCFLFSLVIGLFSQVGLFTIFFRSFFFFIAGAFVYFLLFRVLVHFIPELEMHTSEKEKAKGDEKDSIWDNEAQTYSEEYDDAQNIDLAAFTNRSEEAVSAQNEYRADAEEQEVETSSTHINTADSARQKVDNNSSVSRSDKETKIIDEQISEIGNLEKSNPEFSSEKTVDLAPENNAAEGIQLDKKKDIDENLSEKINSIVPQKNVESGYNEFSLDEKNAEDLVLKKTFTSDISDTSGFGSLGSMQVEVSELRNHVQQNNTKVSNALSYLLNNDEGIKRG